MRCAARGSDCELYCVDAQRETMQGGDRLLLPGPGIQPHSWGEGREKRWFISDRLLVPWRACILQGAFRQRGIDPSVPPLSQVIGDNPQEASGPQLPLFKLFK